MLSRMTLKSIDGGVLLPLSCHFPDLISPMCLLAHSPPSTPRALNYTWRWTLLPSLHPGGRWFITTTCPSHTPYKKATQGEPKRLSLESHTLMHREQVCLSIDGSHDCPLISSQPKQPLHPVLHLCVHSRIPIRFCQTVPVGQSR